MTPSLNTYLEEKLAEFEKKFVVKSNAGTGLLRYTDADKIKSFISALISEAWELKVTPHRGEEKEL